MLEPVLVNLLQDASEGIEKETRDLFRELGVYNLSYERLEELYLAEVLKAKIPGFYRTLILQDHHDKIPRLRAKLMGLHQESNDSIRSIIKDELPLIR
jgi:hypothetical protein